MPLKRSAVQVIRAIKAETSGTSERNKKLAQRMRDALANNQAAYRSLKQDTLLFRQDADLCPPGFCQPSYLSAQLARFGLNHVSSLPHFLLQGAADGLLRGML